MGETTRYGQSRQKGTIAVFPTGATRQVKACIIIFMHALTAPLIAR